MVEMVVNIPNWKKSGKNLYVVRTAFIENEREADQSFLEVVQVP